MLSLPQDRRANSLSKPKRVWSSLSLEECRAYRARRMETPRLYIYG